MPPGQVALASPRARSGGRPAAPAVSGSPLQQDHLPGHPGITAEYGAGQDDLVAYARCTIVLAEHASAEQGSGGE